MAGTMHSYDCTYAFHDVIMLRRGIQRTGQKLTNMRQTCSPMYILTNMRKIENQYRTFPTVSKIFMYMNMLEKMSTYGLCGSRKIKHLRRKDLQQLHNAREGLKCETFISPRKDYGFYTRRVDKKKQIKERRLSKKKFSNFLRRIYRQLTRLLQQFQSPL